MRSTAPVSGPSVVLARFPRTDGRLATEVRVYLQAWQGRLLLHVRYFTKAKSADTWHPTQRGATLRDTELVQLEAAIVEARRLLAPAVEPASARSGA